MDRTRPIALGLAAALTLMFADGCSSTGTFARQKFAMKPGVQYVGGRGYAMYPTTPNLVENVKLTMGELGMHTIHPIPEANGAVAFEALTADKRGARVTIHTTGVRSTVALKVGWLGDEPYTRSFLAKLEDRQGALPASAVPEEVEPEAQGRFSREAVPDSVMIRNQLDSTFNPSIAPSTGP